jgi:hypothetical protein
MTGLVDLTYRHDGKWYVLDYKSNRLPGYDAAALQRAMAHSEYDLQALIYTLALHRWLRFRLRDGLRLRPRFRRHPLPVLPRPRRRPRRLARYPRAALRAGIGARARRAVRPSPACGRGWG